MMLDVGVENSADLKSQLNTARVRKVADYADNWGSIEFEGGLSTAAPPRAVVEALAPDSDGVPINLVLLVANATLVELEIVKMDGTEICSFPSPDGFLPTLVLPPGGSTL
jgi:hypothetical protein